MSLHTEKHLEDEICEHLAANGWLYAAGDAQNYDRALAMFPADVLAWVQQTDADAWEAMQKNHGAAAEQTLLKRLRAAIDQSGTLEVLRQGFDVLGVQNRVKMAQFKPALGTNPKIVQRYEANRLRVVRQVRYSLHNELNIDLVLFVNGIPVATAELKTDFTQSVKDAVDQYRHNRLPQLKGKPPEPLLSFPSGALVHFAVSSSRVEMTTRLSGPATRFLPFNQGDNGAAGNPPNPHGHKTAYLWEQVWRRDSWLDILGRYLITPRDNKKKIRAIIFPRFHQLDVTRKLVNAVLEEGPGGKYLIQHSAGSGKTMSIAWTAHFLSDLHDAANKKVFDTVVVVSDRNVIDTQLREAIEDFERTKGVVASIRGRGGSKSAELSEALASTKKIVICTVQTFPFALDEVRKLSATQGKRFAVIADEAHSSQSGDTSKRLQAVLSAKEQQELKDGGEVSTEDLLAADAATSEPAGGVSFVAFTATPKAKTLEFFGRTPDPTKPPSEYNLPAPYHVYSMRQAIEEGFILDVLQNYTSYKLAFRLANNGKEMDESEVEQAAAMKGLMKWVREHEYNIAEKVKVVIEHYRHTVAPLLEGKAKAMVVVGSRKEAVRWQLALRKYVKQQGYKIGSLVAFSGEVNDSDSGPDPFTENSTELNPALKGRDIAKAFKGDDFQILLVANKYQTGFDQPLLCGMYVDKRLAGIQAVQTLSRLNRAHPGKDKTFVLDFVDPNAADVLAAFKTYYETAMLEDVTDPDIVLRLRTELDSTGYYDEHEIERVVAVELNPKGTQKQLEAAIAPVAGRLLKQYAAARSEEREAKDANDEKAAQAARQRKESLELFVKNMGTYQRAYSFLSQMVDYTNDDFEKRYIFFRYLIRLLKFDRERDTVDLSQVVLTHHTLRSKGQQEMKLTDGESPTLAPITEAGSGAVHEPEKALLSEIIAAVNELFEGEVTDNDKLVYVNNVLMGKLLESETLAVQAANNSKEQFAASPDLQKELLNAIIDALDAHSTMSSQALNSETVQIGLRDILLGPANLYEKLRAIQQGG